MFKNIIYQMSEIEFIALLSQLAMWLIKGDFDTLAEHFVDLNGKMTFEEKKELLLERTRWTYVPRTE